MIGYAGLLVPHAKAAGIKVPKDPEHYPKMNYRAWHVFCNVQIGRPIPHGSMTAVSDNARLIAGLSGKELATITIAELETRGLQ